MRSDGRPWIIAHRGASLRHRENTLAAFRAAAGLGADAIELDVRRTGDGSLVVHHDPTVPGIGPLIDHGLDEIRHAAPWLPTLDEALAACRPLWVNIEIKNSPFEPDWDPSDAVVEAVAASAPEGALVSSFNPSTVARAREIGTTATGYLVFSGMNPLDVLDAAAGHDTVHIAVADMPPGTDRTVVAAAGDRGLAVVVYTTDDAAEIHRLAESGVAGIITNAPDIAAEVLR